VRTSPTRPMPVPWKTRPEPAAPSPRPPEPPFPPRPGIRGRWKPAHRVGGFPSGLPAGAEGSPSPIGAVWATVDTRNAPSALAVFSSTTAPFVRDVIPVHVDNVDTGGGMSDDILTRLASPIDAKDVGRSIDGAMLFTWFPPDPVLGRKSEVLAVAMAYPYIHQTFKPRANPALAELIGLDDLGRALISASTPAPSRPELHEVTGEIKQVKADADTPILDPIEEIRRRRERG